MMVEPHRDSADVHGKSKPSTLPAAGSITHRRARIQILEEAALKRKPCECYRLIRRQFDGLLSDVPEFLSGKHRISNRARQGAGHLDLAETSATHRHGNANRPPAFAGVVRVVAGTSHRGRGRHRQSSVTSSEAAIHTRRAK